MSDQATFLNDIYKLLASDQPLNFRDLVTQKKQQLGISSDHELSKMLDIPFNTLGRIIDGETQKVDLFSVLKICQFLGIDVKEMAETYVASLKPEFVGQLNIATKANFILRNFDLNALKKIGFLKSTTNFEYIDNRLTGFFGLESIFQYGKDMPAGMFSSIKRYSKGEMRKIWMVSAISQFEKWNNNNDYDREALLALIPKIRAYTLDEQRGFIMVVRALYRVGVTIIVQKYIANTAVRGASFIIDDKPCIVVTDNTGKYSTLWFTLLHELSHILFDYDALKAWKFHLSANDESSSTVFTQDENDLIKEEFADEFAQERLFKKAELLYIRPFIDSPERVSRYATEHKVHPSIIYDFYCHYEKQVHGRNVYPKYQHHFGSSKKAIELVRLTPFDEDLVYDGVDRVKSVYEFNAFSSN